MIMKKRFTFLIVLSITLAALLIGASPARAQGGDYPKPRTHHATILVDGWVYVLGGEVPADGTSIQEITLYDDLSKYSFYNPWIRNECDAPEPMSHHTALEWRGSIYTFFGKRQDYYASQDAPIRYYDTEHEQWYVEYGHYGEGYPPAVYGAIDVAGVVVGGKAYFYGGRGKDGAVSDELWTYDFVDRRWDKITTGSPPGKRYGATLEEVGGKLILRGGVNEEGNTPTSVHTFDPEKGQWYLNAPSGLPMPPREHEMVIKYGTDFWVYGGYNESLGGGLASKALADDTPYYFDDLWRLSVDPDDTTVTWTRVLTQGAPSGSFTGGGAFLTTTQVTANGMMPLATGEGLFFSFGGEDVNGNVTDRAYGIQVSGNAVQAVQEYDQSAQTWEDYDPQAPVADGSHNTWRVVPGSGARVTLDGSASYDPDGDLPLTYLWQQMGGAEIADFPRAISVTTFTAPATQSVLTFTLTVTDSRGVVDPTPDSVRVLVDSAPQADAGDDQFVGKGATVTLDGRASSDPDGDSLVYGWTQMGGPSVTLSSATAPTPTFTAAITPTTAYTFSLNVADAYGVEALTADEVVLTVVENLPPTISDIDDQTTTVGCPLTTTFTISDAETVLNDLWIYAEASDEALVYSELSGTIMLNDGLGISGTGFTRTLAVTPTEKLTGTATITVTVDDSARTDDTHFTLTVVDIIRHHIYLPLVMRESE